MASKKSTDDAVDMIGVKQIDTEQLVPNPHNPRMLFDKKPMDILASSIARVGILVPLTVYFDPRKKQYVILDGQRRWMSAQKIGLAKVPVNVVAVPSLVQNILTMFQIHKLREDWELMPTALKVELLMKQLNDRNEKRMAELTGLDEAVIVRCKKLISYPRNFQDMMLDPDPAKRVKADFFIELYPVLHDREISRLTWFDSNQFVSSMLEKYQVEPRTIKAVTDFRTVKQHATNAKRGGAIKEFGKRLRLFVQKHEVAISTLEVGEASVSAEARALVRKVDALIQSIKSLDTDQFYGEEELWVELQTLGELIAKKLRAADKRKVQ